MEYSEHYDNLKNRHDTCMFYESKGFRMISDIFDPDWEKGDEPHGTMIFTDEHEPPPPIEPPKSTHFAKVTGFNPTELRPLSVVRTWEGQEYIHDCFVTQDIVDAYQAGNLSIGDFVLVHFDDSGEQIAMMKIFRTW